MAKQPGATVVMAGRDGAKLDALRAQLGAGEVMTADVLDPKQVGITMCMLNISISECSRGRA